MIILYQTQHQVLYDMDMSQKEIQKSVRNLFRKNAHVSDPRILDRLLYEGEIHLTETVEQVRKEF